MTTNKFFWDTQYQEGNIGWDVGSITTPLKAYFDQLTDKSLSILIPGAGNAYEAEYLNKLGFKNITVVDISPTVIDQFKVRVVDFPKNHILNLDFFELTGQFDLIIEQTFFCAIIPPLRSKYAEQAKRLLKPTGKIVGLMFNAPLNKENPPYGGNCEEYQSYFNPFFDIEIMDSAYNSIESRIGKEVFVKMIKK
jgi:SAM-dependent methyltransferase|tara:strand:+ start:1982 stop:2563 length:582 start_codon:yes stop_codon:yes gene_type:complete